MRPVTLSLNMGVAMAAMLTTSMRSSSFNPTPLASSKPSALAAMKEPMIMLTTSFMLAPLPTCTIRPTSYKIPGQILRTTCKEEELELEQDRMSHIVMHITNTSS